MRGCSTRALSTAGVLRFMGKVENAITKQVQQKMPETDSWFDERAQQVDALQVTLHRHPLYMYNVVPLRINCVD